MCNFQKRIGSEHEKQLYLNWEIFLHHCPFLSRRMQHDASPWKYSWNWADKQSCIKHELTPPCSGGIHCHKSSFSRLKTTFLCGLVRLCSSACCCSAWNTLARMALRESSRAWSRGTESPQSCNIVQGFRVCAWLVMRSVVWRVNVPSEVASKARMQQTVGLFSCCLFSFIMEQRFWLGNSCTTTRGHLSNWSSLYYLLLIQESLSLSHSFRFFPLYEKPKLKIFLASLNVEYG